MANDSGPGPAFDHGQSLKTPSSRAMRVLGIVDNGVNRPIASLIARTAFRTPITPNGLSYASGALGLMASWWFWRGTYVDILVGAAAAQASSIVDGADGMLARARQACTPYGAHLDLVLDRIIDFFVLAGIAAGLWTRSGSPALGMLGLLVAGLYLLQIHLFYLTKSVLGVKATGDTGEARAILYWAIVGFSVADRLDLFVYVMLAETAIVNVVRFVYFVRLGSGRQSAGL
jgi:phosphatidylglycerophosphate synthase